MHSLLTLIKALTLTIALGAPTAALANVATTPATPSVEAPVAPPVVICASGPTWGDAGGEFIENLEAHGAKFLGQSKVFEDGSFGVLFDVRGYDEPLPDPELFVFVLVFDVNECFVTSTFITELGAKDFYGVVIAENN